MEAHFPALAPVQAALMGAHAALLADLNALQGQRLLEGETECIHEPGGGHWAVYTVNAPWHEVDEQGYARGSSMCVCGCRGVMCAA